MEALPFDADVSASACRRLTLTTHFVLGFPQCERLWLCSSRCAAVQLCAVPVLTQVASEADFVKAFEAEALIRLVIGGLTLPVRCSLPLAWSLSASRTCAVVWPSTGSCLSLLCQRCCRGLCLAQSATLDCGIEDR